MGDSLREWSDAYLYDAAASDTLRLVNSEAAAFEK